MERLLRPGSGARDHRTPRERPAAAYARGATANRPSSATGGGAHRDGLPAVGARAPPPRRPPRTGSASTIGSPPHALPSRRSCNTNSPTPSRSSPASATPFPPVTHHPICSKASDTATLTPCSWRNAHSEQAPMAVAGEQPRSPALASRPKTRKSPAAAGADPTVAMTTRSPTPPGSLTPSNSRFTVEPAVEGAHFWHACDVVVT